MTGNDGIDRARTTSSEKERVGQVQSKNRAGHHRYRIRQARTGTDKGRGRTEEAVKEQAG